MALSGLQVINIGLPNESVGSDSLYTAFNKIKTNFATVFANASPYNTFNAGTGISLTANSTTGTLNITNSGVTYLNAGTGVTLSGNTGNITISSTGGGGGGGGTVTSVGINPVSPTRLTVLGSPIVSNGNITLDLAVTGITSGTYTYPTLTVDSYGRVTGISSAAAVGTVTSVVANPGFGIQISSAGNPNVNPSFTITNTGVTRLSAGTGIALSGSSGNVTISTSVTSGTVTSVNITSTNLTISGSPIVTTGTITIDLPSTIAPTTVNSTTVNTTDLNATTVNTTNLNSTTVTANGIFSNSASGLGFTVGAGGSVIQLTSRVTPVTIDKNSGSIELFSDVGSTSYTTFTVNNTCVLPTDVIFVNQQSGADKYIILVTNVNTNSFDITFATTGGTTTEAPVFNFAVIKGTVT